MNMYEGDAATHIYYTPIHDQSSPHQAQTSLETSAKFCQVYLGEGERSLYSLGCKICTEPRNRPHE